MKIDTDRLILNVCRHDGGWAVEEEGRYFGQTPDKDIARASANKRARQVQDSGRACQVRIAGETGFFGG